MSLLVGCGMNLFLSGDTLDGAFACGMMCDDGL